MRRFLSFAVVSSFAALVTTGAHAQQEQLPPPAPQPPPAQYQPPPGQYQVPPPQYGNPGPGQQQAQESSAPPMRPSPSYYQSSSPPPVQVVQAEPVSDTHAPKFSLWAGARLSYMGFGFSFFDNEAGKGETTGNFLGNGVAPELDLGARLGYRYIPYLYWEHGFMGQGHRFEGTNGHATTDFYGIGFRYVSGDADSVAFVSDLSIGKRVISVSNGTQEYSMSGLEFFRLGLGAEIRITTLFTVEPLLSISSGSLNDTSGDVTYNCAPNCPAEPQGNGSTVSINSPLYKNGQTIDSARSYVVLSAGVGIHFDIFGK